MKPKFLDDQAALLLYSFTYPQLLEIEKYVGWIAQQKYPPYAEQEREKCAKSYKSRQLAQKEYQETVVPKIDKLLQTLPEGQWLKFSGTRDGGIRHFMFYDKQTKTATCRQISEFNYDKLGQVTNHMSDKVKAILKDGEWIKIKDFIENCDS